MIFIFYQFVLKCWVNFSRAKSVTTFGAMVVIITFFFPLDPLPEICPLHIGHFKKPFNGNSCTALILPCCLLVY